MDYCVESAETLTDLVRQVNKMLNCGYQCVGGVCVATVVREDDLPLMFFYQALIKE